MGENGGDEMMKEKKEKVEEREEKSVPWTKVNIYIYVRFDNEYILEW